MLNHFLYIDGDNICQIAYWHILFNPHLQGSVGATVPKPALIFLLGPLYDLSSFIFGSPLLISVAIFCFAALLVYEVAQLSMRVAGVHAGILSGLFLIFMTPFVPHVLTGSSMIFYLPILFMGLRLLTQKKYNAGIITLCIAALIRPEALAVVLWFAGLNALQHKWKKVLFAFLAMTISLGIMLSLTYVLQGSMSRLSVGGPSTGYIFSHDPSTFSRFFAGIKFVADATKTVVFNDVIMRYVGISALFALLSFRHTSIYISVASIYIFWIAVSSFIGWSTYRGYFYFLLPFAVAFGISGMWRVLKFFWNKTQKKIVFTLLFLCAGIFLINPVKNALDRFVLNLSFEKVPQYTADTMLFLENPPVPLRSRVLTEDDIVYGVIAHNPDFFQSANALQFFNIQNDLNRQKILEKVDYIVVSKTYFLFYYLWYDPKETGNTDPFRKTIYEMLHDKKMSNVYEHCLLSLENSAHWLVISVKKTCPSP